MSIGKSEQAAADAARVLLAIDTATNMSGIALYDHRGVRTEQMWYSHASHTTELLPIIDMSIRQQGLLPQNLIAVGVSLGPGSFTGVRVGLSIAKGIALGLQIPVLGVPALDVVAYTHLREQCPFCAVIPAGRGRWSMAFYQPTEGMPERTSDYQLLNSAQLCAALVPPTVICGELDAETIRALRGQVAPGVVVLDPAASVRRTGYLAELAWLRLLAGQRDDLQSLAPIYPRQVE